MGLLLLTLVMLFLVGGLLRWGYPSDGDGPFGPRRGAGACRRRAALHWPTLKGNARA